MSEESNEIVHLLTQMKLTWNAGDSAGYAGLFTEDADYITFFGLRLKGRQAIEDTHRELFKTSIKLGEGGGGAPSIRHLTGDVALVIAGGTSSVDGEPDPSRASVVTLTALRTTEGWRFASFQNTRVSRP
ncbi:SgcJ/EcaC family oxidoreductase [Nonomuraea insulae]|uniref:SgcJ/EcaC family oxidoreductase n=1 Tax=Nonomuraea insulae TaxID=1616787 RepID=A0ABW1CCC5_9ACTN